MPGVADRRWRGAEFPGSTDELLAEIARLAAANRDAPDPATASDVLWVRHLAGVRLVEELGRAPEPASLPLAAHVPTGSSGLPEVAAPDVTPELIRAAIQREGCLIVRGLVDPGTAVRFAGLIDRAYAARECLVDGGTPEPGFYEEFVPHQQFRAPHRKWKKAGGGLAASDSPVLSFERMELFEAMGIRDLVSGYFGGPAVLTTQKSTFRRVEPSIEGAWHQDGAFIGVVGSLDLWISLTHCGEQAPGLDIVSRRLDSLVATGTDGAFLPTQVSATMAHAAAGDRPIVRPIFEPGDAVLFDELCLHQTASDPSMTKPRHAIESWFFSASSMPEGYAPIAL